MNSVYWEAIVYGWSSNGDTDLEYTEMVEGSNEALLRAINEAYNTPHVKRVTIEILNKDSVCEQYRRR
tara:strand:- start:475 stop:678 length:204 start_codon:yes stop_codon:yes gene_type:complete